MNTAQTQVLLDIVLDTAKKSESLADYNDVLSVLVSFLELEPRVAAIYALISIAPREGTRFIFCNNFLLYSKSQVGLVLQSFD